MLQGTRFQLPIADNRENRADERAQRGVIAGTIEAVSYIARKEGRSRDVVTAARAALLEPGQGGDTGIYETGRLRLS
jgi:hypothetical protein